jgi:hypothetical protein
MIPEQRRVQCLARYPAGHRFGRLPWLPLSHQVGPARATARSTRRTRVGVDVRVVEVPDAGGYLI